jgi:hypothetical protein
MSPVRVLPGVLLLLLGLTSAGRAQEIGAPAHVAWVEGQVVVEREATREDLGGPTPLVPGERVRTVGGRAEVLFGDGTLLQLDDRTTIDLLSDSLVRLIEGRAMLVVGSGGAGRVQVDTPGGSMVAQAAGEYRLTVFDERGAAMLEVATMRGAAEIFTDEGATTIAAGQRAWAREGELPSHPAPFNSARWDAFDRWSQQRLSARRGVYSARHVPAPLHSYAGVLDSHGYWAHQASYGYVWFPRVSTGWRPYYHGRWRFYGRFGWTWIGADVWAWPTHHYGRWGLSPAGAWFWVPGPQWGPAWVHWAVAPGYVSWCPLGFDNRPVYPFWRAGHRSWAYERWSGWTVVSRQHFGAYRVVSEHALDRGYFASRGAVPAFTVRQAPPDRSFAVARSAFVDDTPRSIAVRRGTAASGGRVAPSGRAASDSAAVAAPRARSAPGTAVERGARVAPGTRDIGSDPAGERRRAAGARADDGSAVSTAPADAPGQGTRTAVPRRAAPPPGVSTERGTGVPAGARAVASPARGDTGQAAPESPGHRTAAPRSDAAGRVWSPDQVPVHRGSSRAATAGDDGAVPRTRTVPDASRPPAGTQEYGRTVPRRAAPPVYDPGTRGSADAPTSYGPRRRVAPPREPAPAGPGAAAPVEAPSRYDAPRRAAPPPPASGPQEGGEGRAIRRGGGSTSYGAPEGPARAAPPAYGAPAGSGSGAASDRPRGYEGPQRAAPPPPAYRPPAGGEGRATRRGGEGSAAPAGPQRMAPPASAPPPQAAPPSAAPRQAPEGRSRGGTAAPRGGSARER